MGKCNFFVTFFLKTYSQAVDIVLDSCPYSCEEWYQLKARLEKCSNLLKILHPCFIGCAQWGKLWERSIINVSVFMLPCNNSIVFGKIKVIIDWIFFWFYEQCNLRSGSIFENRSNWAWSQVMNNDTGLAWHCSSLHYFICKECTSKLHVQYWFSLFGLLLLYHKITDCQQAASQRCKAARWQPNRDVRNSSRGRKNLGLM